MSLQTARPPSKSEPKTRQLAGRLESLDVFRGVTIAGMILVNNAGNWQTTYAPLRHAAWDGWTPTDLIFPFFLFIVGVAMTFSFSRRLEQGKRSGLYLQILRRSAVIFALGLFLNAFPDFQPAELRVAGVLQRIAVVYLIASLVYLHTTVRGQIVALAAILLSYWAMMSLLPVPGHGPGVLTPEGNFAAYLDSYLLPGKFYRQTWDPEGVMSTLPAVGTALAGTLTGEFLRRQRAPERTAGWLFMAGWGAILLGLFWDIWFPINKNLWSSSYVAFSAGAALQFLGVCFWLLEVAGWKRWAYPAVVYGTNAIAVYVLSGMMSDLLRFFQVAGAGETLSLWRWIYLNGFASWLSPHNASLAMSFSYVLLWFFIMQIFYRRAIFLKV